MTRESNRSLTVQLALAAGLMLVIVTCRLGIDTPNFHPVMAVALFSGYLFSRRWLGLLAVVSGMILSDALIGFYQWQIAVVVYLALTSPLLAGLWLRYRRLTGVRLGIGVAGISLVTAIIFYLTTNLAVWSWSSWYAVDLSGLATCLAMGLPFFKWTLISNLLFSAILFGGNALVGRLRIDPIDFAGRQLVAVPARRRNR